jgi:carbonic anhydrase
MDMIESLTRRNETFATGDFTAGLKMLPWGKTVIIGCVDPRVDPVQIFGLAVGEAAVIRNVGGRIDPATLQTMGILRAVAKSQGVEIGEGWNLIVLHHTNCGITPCLHHAPEMLAKHLAVTPEDLSSLAIEDPYAAVVLDVAALKANPKLPGGFLVTGLVYDVATGRVETVVPSALLRPDRLS